MINFIKNIFRKNEDKIFEIDREPKNVNVIGLEVINNSQTGEIEKFANVKIVEKNLF